MIVSDNHYICCAYFMMKVAFLTLRQIYLTLNICLKSMNRLIRISFAFLALLTCHNTIKAANTIEVDGNTYNVLSVTDLTCELYRSNGDKKVFLPSTIEYNGKTLDVIGVAQGALIPSFEANGGVAILYITEDCQYIESQNYIYNNRYYSYTGIVIPSLESYLKMRFSTHSYKEVFLTDGTCLTDGHLELPGNINDFNCRFAFSYCTNITSVGWSKDDSVPVYDDEFRCHLPEYTFAFCEKLESISLPSCILDNAALAGCVNLSSVSFTDSGWYHIGHHAFYQCEKLEKIDGSLAYSINYAAFNECKSLKELTFADTPIQIYSEYDKSNVYPYSEFYYGCFNQCNSLARINVPNNEALLKIKYIGPIYGTEKIGENFIEKNALFYNCESGSIYVNGKKMTKVAFDTPSTRINAGLFYNAGDLEVDLTNVHSIGPYAFNKCKMSEIFVPEAVDSIGNYALSANLVEFEHTTSKYYRPLGNDVEDVRIDNCEYLLGLGKGFGYGSNSGESHKNIRNITIKYLNCDIANNEFKDCSALETFDVTDHGEKAVYIGKNAFDGTVVKHFKVPSNVVDIARKAFTGKFLETLEITSRYDLNLYCDGVGENGDLGGTFHNCYNLTTLVVNTPGTVYFYRQDIFTQYPWRHSNIKKIVFGDNKYSADVDFYVTGKEDYYTYRFGKKYNAIKSQLEELEFGVNVQRIYLKGWNIFLNPHCTSYDSSKIKSITLKSVIPPELTEGSFSDWSLINATVTVPEIALESYKSHPVWGKFWNIKGEDFGDSSVHDMLVPEKANVNDVYTLQGILLKRNASQDYIDALPAGLYIIGGKKYVIRK